MHAYAQNRNKKKKMHEYGWNNNRQKQMHGDGKNRNKQKTKYIGTAKIEISKNKMHGDSQNRNKQTKMHEDWQNINKQKKTAWGRQEQISAKQNPLVGLKQKLAKKKHGDGQNRNKKIIIVTVRMEVNKKCIGTARIKTRKQLQ